MLLAVSSVLSLCSHQLCAGTVESRTQEHLTIATWDVGLVDVPVAPLRMTPSVCQIHATVTYGVQSCGPCVPFRLRHGRLVVNPDGLAVRSGARAVEAMKVRLPAITLTGPMGRERSCELHSFSAAEPQNKLYGVWCMARAPKLRKTR